MMKARRELHPPQTVTQTGAQAVLAIPLAFATGEVGGIKILKCEI